MKIFAFKAMTWLFSLVHPRFAPLLAKPLAFLIWHVSSRLRKVGIKNISLAYPELSEREQVSLAKKSMEHYARNLLEAGIVWCWSWKRFDRLFEEPVGMELIEREKAAGHGVVFLAPHYGAWEMLGLRVSDLLDSTLYKPGSDEAINEALIKSRERFGAHLVPANRRGLKAIMDSLKNGEVAAVLPDQEPKLGDGVFAPFFGVPALTGVLGPRLIGRTDAKAVFAVLVRLPKGRYRIHVLPAHEDIYSDDMETAVTAVNEGVERCIALDPPQYLWAYKRYRTRPEGEKSFY